VDAWDIIQATQKLAKGMLERCATGRRISARAAFEAGARARGDCRRRSCSSAPAVSTAFSNFLLWDLRLRGAVFQFAAVGLISRCGGDLEEALAFFAQPPSGASATTAAPPAAAKA